MLRRARLPLSVLTALLAAGCSDGRVATPARSLLLVSLDTTRADHLSAYGYERQTTPWLKELSDQGVRFEHCVSASSWTVPSMAALHSGAHPWTLGMHAAPSLKVQQDPETAEHPLLPARVNTLAERFAAAGFRTGGLTANRHLEESLGWAQLTPSCRTSCRICRCPSCGPSSRRSTQKAAGHAARARGGENTAWARGGEDAARARGGAASRRRRPH